MGFGSFYLQKYITVPEQLCKPPADELNIIIVIPCFNEPDVILTLNSLFNCIRPAAKVEVIVVINSSENSPLEILQTNKSTKLEILDWIEGNSSAELQFHLIYQPKLPEKFAGAGLARKIGMDEAIRRFDYLNKPGGIIVSYDADTLCDPNYLIEIERFFKNQPKANACSIYFEHPIDGDLYGYEIYMNIIRYELFLRYYIEALRQTEFPYAFHSIGSAFAVNASIYAKQGGMNRKKAGEDFYFLQKIIPLGKFGEINATRVIPSPRVSNRVPFGTGPSIQKMLLEPQKEYLTYCLSSFLDLHALFKNHFLFFRGSENILKEFVLPGSVVDFLKQNMFFQGLIKIQENSPNLKIFKKRFYDWFNSFRILKFLNFAHEKYYQKEPVYKEAGKLLKLKGIKSDYNGEKELLIQFRQVARKGMPGIYPDTQR
jgi:hypothetical protein